VGSLTERLGLPTDREPRLLVTGAHPDDAEIGAGATIARLVSERPGIEVTWLVLAAADARRADEARASAERLLASTGRFSVDVRAMRDGFLPFIGEAPKDALIEHAATDPDVIIGPRLDDAHQDHRLLAELMRQVFRRGTILEYEVPKWDGDLGTASLYIPLTREQVASKVEHLLSSFPSQRDRSWFSEETFRAILRLRGIECHAADGYAEAFVCRKLVV